MIARFVLGILGGGAALGALLTHGIYDRRFLIGVPVAILLLALFSGEVGKEWFLKALGVGVFVILVVSALAEHCATFTPYMSPEHGVSNLITQATCSSSRTGFSGLEAILGFFGG